MEVKVLCSCGQKYKFDIEPVNGRMTAPIACPVCGVDGTETANAFIQQASSVPVEHAPAGTPTEQTPSLKPVVPSGPSRIRLNIPSQTEHAAPQAVVAATPAPIQASANVPAPAVAGPRPYPPGEPSVFMGILGAVVAGIIGVIVWSVICNVTGMKLRFLAIGVGSLTGYGARLLCKTPSTKLGVSAAVTAFFVILVGQLLMAKSRMDRFVETAAGEGYEARVTVAREATAAIPTGSDLEIRTFLAKRDAVEGEKPDPSQVTTNEIKEFHDRELPELRDLASGKMTKEKYRQSLTKIESADGNTTDVEETGIYKIILVLMSFGLFGAFWLIAGVGSAFKIASGASGS